MHILYFAQLREILDSAEEDLQVGEGITPRQLFDMLARRDAHLRFFQDSLVFFVNEERDDGDGALRQGDVVAFCPPVSGG